MRALVVGGAGFIGRAVVRCLLADGWHVLVGDSLAVKPEEPIPGGVDFRWLDVRYYSQIAGALEWACPDVVLWLAARQGYGPDWRWFAQVNVTPMYGLAEAIREAGVAGRPVKLVVLASSQAVYSPGLGVREAAACEPTSVYGLSKLQGELAARFFAEAGGPPVVALRPSIVLGAGQSCQSTESGVLRNWARAAAAGSRPEIYGTGEHVRDFVHVEDVARAFALACQDRPGGVRPPFQALNLAGHPESLLGLARRFCEAWDWSPEPAILGRAVRPGGEFSLTSDGTAAAEALDWRPEIGVEEQVGDFVRWFRGRGPA